MLDEIVSRLLSFVVCKIDKIVIQKINDNQPQEQYSSLMMMIIIMVPYSPYSQNDMRMKRNPKRKHNELYLYYVF